MLSTEIKINGRMIGHLYILNLMKIESQKTLYEVEYYQVGQGSLVKTQVWHDVSYGAEALVALALEAVREHPDYKPFNVPVGPVQRMR